MTPPKPYLVTIGTFDGVHRGHQKLMRWVRRLSRRLRMHTRVVFFASPPRFYFCPQYAHPLLTTSLERRAILKSLGVDRVEILRFGPRWARMPHERFFEDYLVRRWKAGGVLVGRDFAFGTGRKGDLEYLRKACASRGMRLGILPLVRVKGRKISSRDIRRLLDSGRVAEAGRLLGRPHALTGRVVRGLGLGAKLGFPTANLKVSPELLAPPGVFHVRAEVPHAGALDAVCAVGYRPTLGRGLTRAVEVHIPGWSGDLYGKTLRIEFLRKLRGEKKFKSLEALRRAIARDIGRIASPS
jgi:riboflavin kinase/FMN adenylyltransferase